MGKPNLDKGKSKASTESNAASDQQVSLVDLGVPEKYIHNEYLKREADRFVESKTGSVQLLQPEREAPPPFDPGFNDPNQDTVTTLSNGAKIKLLSTTSAGELVGYRRPTINNYLKTKIMDRKSFVFRSQDICKVIETPGFLHFAFIKDTPAVERIIVRIEGTIVSDIRLNFSSQQKTSDVINISQTVAPMQIPYDLVNLTLECFFAEEVPESMEEITVYFAVNIMSMQMYLANMTSYGCLVGPATPVIYAEHAKNTKGSIAEAGIFHRGTYHVPIKGTYSAADKTVTFVADKDHLCAAGLILSGIKGFEEIRFGEIRIDKSCIKMPEGTAILTFGDQFNPIQAHTNSLYPMKKGDKVEFVLGDASVFSEDGQEVEGFLVEVRYFNVFKQRVAFV